VSTVPRLPFTGLDKEKLALLLSGIGLMAIGTGLALRRRLYRGYR
jgi:LPXTG-motif cell wall-anchored protein